MSDSLQVRQLLQELCDEGQRQLMATEYLAAEATLVRAESLAREAGDFDTLARLYMPLQETRRQCRQRAGEGTVCLDLLPRSPAEQLSAEELLKRYSHGQFLLAGFGTIQPALDLRALQAARGIYVETFLAAVYPVAGQLAVVLVPTANVALPGVEQVGSIDQLVARLPPHCVVMHENELPTGAVKGTWETYAYVMSLWEKLHKPWLAQAASVPDPLRRIEAYRQTIEVDYACELAHQFLSNTAKSLAKTQRK